MASALETVVSLSHPTGVRGLKFGQLGCGELAVHVAPHWGAWIEMTTRGGRPARKSVAPHWGAWIEISILLELSPNTVSHPTGVRGLKSRNAKDSDRPVWSHPTGVRGLKYHA